ncbi:TPA: GntR family transcriptional regulator [Clostridium perfringens]|uniref:GntR family transcriptional regulator n=1 Tax=Clostridium perfringens TaxID=1502 RepID=UPI000D91222E|nr:GntR family transcriptional regulator [Clostridium perfringens]MDM0493206.1 GntR family transcriptional regulator [Clostridium perfringens]MDU2663878.1 GntR family transcriptional regulator [Clostridium perfringens]MDU6174760.1 GntR family transcriptional regulator [Clostridium perfringens]MDU7885655.1 GntR family transcriptional regulator [Clostridium perfringens]
MKIDKNSKTPLYLQLMDIFIDEIDSALDENEQLLSEREICDKYNVSRTTVRQTMDELEKAGYIYKVHGKGTFVSSKRVEQDLIAFYSFTDEMKKIGKIPSSQIISFEIIEAGDKLGDKFGILDNDLLFKLIRLRKADELPMIYEITYLPFDRFNNLNKDMLTGKAMYEVLRENFSTKFTFAEEYFEPILTNKLESVYLKVKEGSPSLKIERFTYEKDNLIEYTKSIARGDKFKYKVKLNNTK